MFTVTILFEQLFKRIGKLINIVTTAFSYYRYAICAQVNRGKH